MAITKWDAGWVDRGNVLSTELNSLAAAAISAAGTEVANQTNLDTFGQLELQVTFGTVPAAGGTVVIYMTTAPDGTNYGNQSMLGVRAVIPVAAVTTAQRLITAPFRLEPVKTKFILHNATNQAFPATGSVVKLYTQNEETA